MICDFSNVAFSVFGFPIHWYSLAYIFGIIFALLLTKKIAAKVSYDFPKDVWDDFLNYAVLGIVLGGRIGHVLFYDFSYYIEFPSEIIKIWKGGMSFFGGFLGVICATYLFCQRKKIDFLQFIDLWSVSVPIGLFLGRLANFINGELLGKPSTIAWNVIFKDRIPRHPSQIYEAVLEGVILFCVMIISLRAGAYKFRGKLSGIFCMGYGVARFTTEFFREPDSPFSFELLMHSGINLNQYLSTLLFGLGFFLIRKKTV